MKDVLYWWAKDAYITTYETNKWGVAMDYAASLVKRFSFLSIYGGVTLFSIFFGCFPNGFPYTKFWLYLAKILVLQDNLY